MKYQIRGLWKRAEVDDYEQGCIGPSADHWIDLQFTAADIPATIKKAADFVGVDSDGIELDACDETGRIDFARTETDDGSELTPAEVAKWKAGELRAWYCVYTGYLEKVETVSACQ
jgi:hypothetical protein